MKKLPKNCLTCKFMDFVDDELEEMHCFEPEVCRSMGADVNIGCTTYENSYCDAYEVNKAVAEDANQGCW